MKNTSTVTIGAFGGEGGDSWDDGVYSGVRQLIISSSEMIESIEIEYDQNGQSQWSDTHGTKQGTINTVKLDYPSEFLISVSGYIDYQSLVVIHSLTLESNKRTYGPFGTEKGEYFNFIPSKDNKIIGFHGRAGHFLDSIGAYCEPISPEICVGPLGGPGGDPWDDGSHTAVRKLIVYSSDVIGAIQIEYEENGQSKWSDTHGCKEGTINKVELDFPSEFLISVSGYIDSYHSLVVVHSLTFESNRRKYGPFGIEKGESFKFPSTGGNQIIGLHGRAGLYLDSLGAYVKPALDLSPWTTVGPFGGQGGDPWDDGVHNSVRELVIYSSEVIESIQVGYDENDQLNWSATHGRKEGTKSTVAEHNSLVVIHSLAFESNKRTYGPFGTTKGEYFTSPSTNGSKIIGFHGRSGFHLDSVGAYLKSTSQHITVGPFGGQGGDSWDDGVHSTVRQLIISYSLVISSIEVEYDENGQSKWSNSHGVKHGTRKTVELDYPSECLRSVSGYVGTSSSMKLIRSLTFESNRRTYGPFGKEEGEYFKFPSTNGKIVGFHGRSGVFLDSVGAYSEP